jgi:hypothetical protein
VGLPYATKLLQRFLKIPEVIQNVLETQKIKQRSKIQTFAAAATTTTTNNNNNNKSNNNNFV